MHSLPWKFKSWPLSTSGWHYKATKPSLVNIYQEFGFPLFEGSNADSFVPDIRLPQIQLNISHVYLDQNQCISPPYGKVTYILPSLLKQRDLELFHCLLQRFHLEAISIKALFRNLVSQTILMHEWISQFAHHQFIPESIWPLQRKCWRWTIPSCQYRQCPPETAQSSFIFIRIVPTNQAPPIPTYIPMGRTKCSANALESKIPRHFDAQPLVIRGASHGGEMRECVFLWERSS